MKKFSKGLLKTIILTILLSIVPLLLIAFVVDTYFLIFGDANDYMGVFWIIVFTPFILAVTLPLAIVTHALIVFFERKDSKEKNKSKR